MRMHCVRHRRIGVPKGFLRHVAIQLLRHGPMSGSEIMDQILEYTEYKPSPGSIYPLLAQLHEEGLIEQSVEEEASLKRYSLTEEGQAELHEIMAHDDQLRRRQRVIRKMYWRLHMDLPEQLYTSFSDLIDAFEERYQVAVADTEKRSKLVKILDDARLGIEAMEAGT